MISGFTLGEMKTGSNCDWCWGFSYAFCFLKDYITHMHGFTVYVNKWLPFAWDLSLENSEVSYLCFRLPSYFFFCHQSSHLSFCTVFDVILSKIMHLSLKILTAIILVNLFLGMELVNFFISNDLTQIVDFPTWTHDCDSHIPVLLDLFISSDSSICSTVVFLPSEIFLYVVVFRFPLTSQQTQKRISLFIAKLMTILVLIGTIFVGIDVYISLIINIRSSLTHPHGIHLCILIIRQKIF